MTTIGDLTLNDIDNTEIRIEYRGDAISGTIRDIRTDTSRLLSDLLIGGQKHCRGERFTRVKITFTNFIVSDLPLDHPCEVIA
ncbi:hypothetical protein HMPREF3159_03470 [Brachybacterium sp. HMSC06H03]|uniref:hypothetical protein n=1 Tax=Brachybacterium sp. HMSC06H03 TaxID=1581127 RepID=UPI0008A3FB67|nr:hypothetical protein [Brachybacterium sp. HMSC06H03]OFT62584.1 hypothetical protein HMPREF3159_03470 [Brachybacterium sp. HMSC06H03]